MRSRQEIRELKINNHLVCLNLYQKHLLISPESYPSKKIDYTRLRLTWTCQIWNCIIIFRISMTIGSTKLGRTFPCPVSLSWLISVWTLYFTWPITPYSINYNHIETKSGISIIKIVYPTWCTVCQPTIPFPIKKIYIWVQFG